MVKICRLEQALMFLVVSGRRNEAVPRAEVRAMLRLGFVRVGVKAGIGAGEKIVILAGLRCEVERFCGCHGIL